MMTSMLVRGRLAVVKRGIWLIVPLLLLTGASACSAHSVTTATIEPAGSGLGGVEVIVHRAPS